MSSHKLWYTQFPPWLAGKKLVAGDMMAEFTHHSDAYCNMTSFTMGIECVTNHILSPLWEDQKLADEDRTKKGRILWNNEAGFLEWEIQ